MSIEQLSHSDGPDTENEAIERHEASGRAAAHRQIVWCLVKQYVGSTSAELAEHTHLDKHEVRRRLTDLLNRGDIKQGDKRACRVAGTAAVVWVPRGRP